MADTPQEYESKPQPAEHLRPLSEVAQRSKTLFALGLVLLLLVAVLTVVAPSALWFLLYPVLILGALAALATAAAWLLRHLD